MTTIQVSTDTATDSKTRLSGLPLWVGRVVWLVLVGFTVYFLILIIPKYFQIFTRIVGSINPFDIGRLSLEMNRTLNQIGLTTDDYARFITGIYVATAAISLLLGIFIAARRSDDWMSLLASLFIIAFGITFSLLVNAVNVSVDEKFFVVPAAATTIALLSFVLFIYFFPNGRFVPRVLLPAAAINILLPLWLLIQWILLIRQIANISARGVTLSFYFTWRMQAGFSGSLLAIYLAQLVGLGVVAQALRYFRYSTDVQRQQAKWLVLGITLVFLTFSLFIAPPLILGYAFPSILKNVGDVLFLISLIAIPMTLGFSVLRYRIWDVDFVINRSLVYGITTLILAAVFVAGFAGVRAVLEIVLGGEQVILAAVLPAVSIALLFNPTRKRLRRLIDRRFYGIEIAYTSPGVQIPAVRSAITSVADYTDLQPIGSGGMGDVYRAVHMQTGQTVAVKMLPTNLAQDDQFVRRFEREAQVISTLQHPHIVQLVDYGQEADTAYLVMEYIAGVTLAHMINERGALTLADAVPVLEGLASALDYAHEQGIVHRDIKPSNVMVGEDGRVVLMDFGIARMAGLTQLTATGGMVGTLDYIAPEQIQGASNVDHRADIYSLGVMAYQMLTGERPFKKNNPGALIMAHLLEPPPDACALVSELPGYVCAALRKAMAKKPEDRFTTVSELLAAMTA